MELLLLQTANRKWCMAHRIQQFRWPWVTFEVFHLLHAFSNVFVQLCSSW